MALIKCPECGKEISDTAKSCPNCGYMIHNKKSFLQFLSDGTNCIISIVINIVLSIIGITMFSKGKSEMLFWVKMKSELGVEDAMHCIRNIQKYTIMKNVGIAFICVGIVLTIFVIAYKVLNATENKNIME